MTASIAPSLCCRIAEELTTAARVRRPVVPLSTRYPALTLDDAYAIQTELRAIRLANGARLVGHKIGATSEPIRTMFGIDHPDFGFITDQMLLPNDARIDGGRLIAPKVEGEIAFRLGADLRGDTVTARQVLDHAVEVVPVLEVLDSRIANWAIRLVDTVADNASSAMVVCGAAVPIAGADLAAEQMTLDVDGLTYIGQGSAVLGHPAESVAWLARLLAGTGQGLRAGDLVLAGAWTAAVDLAAGSDARASFSSLGSVSLTMSQNPGSARASEPEVTRAHRIGTSAPPGT